MKPTSHRHSNENCPKLSRDPNLGLSPPKFGTVGNPSPNVYQHMRELNSANKIRNSGLQVPVHFAKFQFAKFQIAKTLLLTLTQT